MLNEEYKQGLDSYRFVGAEINSETLSIKNDIIENIITNMGTCFEANRIPVTATDDIPIEEDMSQVLNILGLPAFYPKQGVETLYDEMSLAMYNTISGLFESDINFWQGNKRVLLIDYLLSTSICLVEQYNKLGNTIDKFYATRNPFLIAEFTGNEAKINKYLSHIKYNQVSYETGMLTLIKLRNANGGVKETIPRTPTNFNLTTRITPFFITRGLLDHLDTKLQNSILRVKYIKDNITVRELITTKDMGYLAKYYDSGMTSRMILNQKSNLLRGYTHVPELGISKYDESGTRALSISRIIKMEEIQPSEVETRFINVYFPAIVPAFKQYITNLGDINKLQEVFLVFTGNQLPPQVALVDNAKELILSFIDTQVLVGTTTAQKRLHLYMVSRPDLFPNYTGLKPTQHNGNSGMMGVVE